MIDLDRLKTTLMTSGLQKKDNSLFQVINSLIEAIRAFQVSVVGSVTGTTGVISTATFLTANNDLPSLPNSRQLLAGTNITFDDSIFGFRTVNGSGSGSGDDYVVASDGGTPTPTPMDDGFGNFIYVIYTP